MAEIKVPTPNPMSRKEDAKKPEKQPEKKAKLKEKSFKQKVKEAIIADDVGDLKEYAVIKVLIPAAKKTLRNLLLNLFDMKFFGKSLGTGERRSSGGQVVDYNGRSSSMYIDDADELQRIANKKQASSGVALRVYELNRVQWDTEDEALEALRYLRSRCDDFNVVSVRDYLEYAKLSYNNAHEKYGWIGVDSLRFVHPEFDPDTEMWFLTLPKVKYL